MVDALAAAMGRKAEFVPSDWETLVSALQRKSFDVIVNGLEPTADRQKQIQFSKPYYIFQLALTVRKDDERIHSLNDCKNKVVGTLGNTAASRLLQKEGVPFKNYAEPPTAYRDLELKRIDAVIMDVPAEVFYVSKSTTLKRACDPFFRGTYNIGLRKGDDAVEDGDRCGHRQDHKRRHAGSRFCANGDCGTTRNLSCRARRNRTDKIPMSPTT